jgi:soluble lytic murein transglycosylase
MLEAPVATEYTMKKLLCGMALALLAQAAAAATPDERVLEAREAFRLGDRAKLARQLETVRGHELEPYVEYWLLRLRLEEAAPGEVGDFVTRHGGSYVAEKLRSDWLKVLGKRGQWEIFDRIYSRAIQPDQELACYALQSRLQAGDPSALDEGRPLWFRQLDLPDSCVPVMERLIADGRLKASDVWRRLRLLLENKRPGAAKRVAEYLPEGQRPNGKAVDLAADKPHKYLDKLPRNFADSGAGRELALVAVARLARQDPREAAERWHKIKSRFSAAERAYVYGQLGWQAALRHLPEAVTWYQQADDASLSEEQLAWKARAGLRALDWQLVHDTIEAMPREQAAQPVWVYWLGRAHVALGRQEQAHRLYASISGQPNFYSNLADDELGRPIAVPPPANLTQEEIQAAEANPGIRRTLALFRLGMRIDGVREWNWTVRELDDRGLLAAAEVANRAHIFDRAISAADRTTAQHNYALRYPAPFLDQVAPKARQLNLDHAWVYGLMRQESRFVMDARSPVGASGLMQLMPKTAAWVARKLGLKDFHPTRVNDMEVNVTLGTNYLKMVLEDLDNQLVLASAAYNAGPGRARRWRDAKPLEGAIYAETIPISETRDYVKKVMSNAVYYAALFEGRPQSLKSRLGVIAPSGGDQARGEALP